MAEDTTRDLADTNRDLAFIVRVTAVATLYTLAVTWKIYLPGFRIFAPVPVISLLSSLPECVNWGIYLLGVSLLVWLCIAPLRRLPAQGIVLCFLFWVLQDMNRLQPYNVMYYFTFFIAACHKERKTPSINALRIMVCGVYFWAGFHKLNLSFYTSMLPWFIAPLHSFSGPHSTSIADTVFALAIIATPVFEAAIGILLFFPRARLIATSMAFVMLTVVLVCLGPLGHNWNHVVWMWNIYLFAVEVRLFLTKNTKTVDIVLFSKSDPRALFSLVFFAVAPVLAIFYPSYGYVGFKLYSANIYDAEIVFGPGETFSRCPAYLKKLVRSGHTLRLLDWTEEELGNLSYPAPYSFRHGAAGLCPYLDHPEKAKLEVHFPPPFYSIEKVTEETPLCQ